MVRGIQEIHSSQLSALDFMSNAVMNFRSGFATSVIFS